VGVRGHSLQSCDCPQFCYQDPYEIINTLDDVNLFEKSYILRNRSTYLKVTLSRYRPEEAHGVPVG
jgi:hypothetical protein